MILPGDLYKHTLLNSTICYRVQEVSGNHAIVVVESANVPVPYRGERIRLTLVALERMRRITEENK